MNRTVLNNFNHQQRKRVTFVFVWCFLILFTVGGGSLLAETGPDLDWLAGQTAVSYQNYQIQVTTRNDSNRITVSVDADLRVSIAETDRFYFLLAQFSQLQIEEAKLNGKPVSLRKQAEVYWVDLPASKKRGDVLSFGIRYSFRANAASKTVLLELTGNWYPRSLVPDPATAEVELVAPPGYFGVGNGNLQGVRTYPFQQMGYVWRTSQPLTALGVAVGRYQIATKMNKGRLYRLFYLPGTTPAFRDKLLEQGAAVGEFFLGKFGGVAFTEFSIVMNDFASEADSNCSSLIFIHVPGNRANRFSLFTLAHEMAHYWWGNLVYPKTLHDWWLAEGFANYSAYLALERVAPDAPQTRAQLQQWRSEYEKAHRESKSYQISELSLAELSPYDLQRELLYHKGAYVLHMTRVVLGETKFGNYLAEFVRRYANRPAGIRDFTGLGVELYGAPLLDFYRQWVYTAGWYNITLRNVTVQAKQGKFVVSFTIQNTGQLNLPETVDLEIITGSEVYSEALSFRNVNVTMQRTLPAKPKRIMVNGKYNILEPNVADNIWTNRF